jgi:hypothetical protein
MKLAVALSILVLASLAPTLAVPTAAADTCTPLDQVACVPCVFSVHNSGHCLVRNPCDPYTCRPWI